MSAQTDFRSVIKFFNRHFWQKRFSKTKKKIAKTLIFCWIQWTFSCLFIAELHKIVRPFADLMCSFSPRNHVNRVKILPQLCSSSMGNALLISLTNLLNISPITGLTSAKKEEQGFEQWGWTLVCWYAYESWPRSNCALPGQLSQFLFVYTWAKSRSFSNCRFHNWKLIKVIFCSLPSWSFIHRVCCGSNCRNFTFSCRSRITCKGKWPRDLETPILEICDWCF